MPPKNTASLSLPLGVGHRCRQLCVCGWVWFAHCRPIIVATRAGWKESERGDNRHVPEVSKVEGYYNTALSHFLLAPKHCLPKYCRPQKAGSVQLHWKSYSYCQSEKSHSKLAVWLQTSTQCCHCLRQLHNTDTSQADSFCNFTYTILTAYQ